MSRPRNIVRVAVSQILDMRRASLVSVQPVLEDRPVEQMVLDLVDSETGDIAGVDLQRATHLA